VIVPTPALSEAKTKALLHWLAPFRAVNAAGTAATALLLIESPGAPLLRAARNLRGVRVDSPTRTDAFSLLRPARVLATAPALTALLLRAGLSPAGS